MAVPRDASVKWEKEDPTSEKTSLERSRSSSRIRLELEGPNGIVTRNGSNASGDETPPAQALRSMSVASEPGLPDDVPNWPNGWRPWASLIGCHFLMFNSWGIVNAYGTYSSFYNQHLLPNASLLELNLIGATQCAVIMAMAFIMGRFLDAGYYRSVIRTGATLVLISVFLLSVVTGDGQYNQGIYWAIWLLQGFVGSVGFGCFFIASSQIAATWFQKRKSFAIGFVASGASTSGFAYPLILNYLIPKYGFNNAQRFSAVLTAGTLLITVLTAKPNPTQIVRRPESWTNLRVFIDKDAFHNASFNWMTASISFLFLGFYPIFFGLEEWAVSNGIGLRETIPGGVEVELVENTQDDAMRTYWLLAFMNIASITGRLSSGFLSDHFGALNVHCVVTFISGVLVIAFWPFVNTVEGAIGFVITFGAFSGAVIGLPPASMAYILGPKPSAQAKLGQWTGMMYTFAAIPALIGPIIVGAGLAATGRNFWMLQGFSGACLIISSFCMLMAIYVKRREKYNEMFRRRLSSVNSTGGLLSRFMSRETAGTRDPEMGEVSR